jgi:Mrp family chromosome partitioning ATPase
VATVVEQRREGGASVLVGGGPTANPPALLAGTRMRGLLRAVAEDHDTVLVDAPPPLAVSDTMPLLASVDGIVIVARVGHTRLASARRLMQLLERTATAPVLGVVARDASGKELERYGFRSAYEQHGLRRKLVGR